MASNGPASQKTKLIVNYLPQEMSDNEFRSMFVTLGPLKNARVMREKNTGYSFGYGFIEYQELDDAAKAIETLDGLEVQNKRLKVAYSRDNPDSKGAKLYVKNLPTELSDEQFLSVLRPYGTIISHRLIPDRETGLLKGDGYVIFNTRMEAIEAQKGLHCRTPPGYYKDWNVSFAQDNSRKVKPPAGAEPFQPGGAGAGPGFFPSYEPMPFGGYDGGFGGLGGGGGGPMRGPSRGRGGRSRFNPLEATTLTAKSGNEDEGYKIFIYGIGKDSTDETLWSLFSPFGSVLKATVALSTDGVSNCKGYGFITMADRNEGSAAITALNGYTLVDKPLQVNFKK